MSKELEGLLKFGCDHCDEGDAATFWLLCEERKASTEELEEAAERAVKAAWAAIR